jgi:hypothetical protein
MAYSRCVGYTKTFHRCRRRLKSGQLMFCCSGHTPSNWDEIENEDCYICGNTVSQVYILACGHATHSSCLEQWLVTSSNRTCPLCRHETRRPIGL